MQPRAKEPERSRTMRAVVRDRYGSADVLSLGEVGVPYIGADQVLIRVRGSSVNMGDRLMMRGEPYAIRLALRMGCFRPRARGLGQDVAGRVVAVGARVSDLAVGDEVYGEVTGGQTWAEYAAAPAKALARKPGNITFEEAGAVPLAAITALQAARDHGRVQPGQRVLVNGGSGSVGSYAVQIARALGAEVTAVCSARNAERARQLGAAHVLDSTRDDFTRPAAPFDVLLDVAGNRSLGECLRALKPLGTYVAIGFPIRGPWLQPLGRLLWTVLRGKLTSQRVVVFEAKPSREDLDALTALIEAGKVAPAFDTRCELADLPAAMRELELGTRRGKVAVEIA